MKRSAFLNRLLAGSPQASYLEIGVHEGETFHAVDAARKVGVDPAFSFDWKQAERENPGTRCHQMTSDAYFGGGSGEPIEPFDVVFIDGLHTFEQTLRDLLNAITVLRPDGVIVLDDVLPNSQIAAFKDWADVVRHRALGEPWDGSWMGDVYRLVFFVETFMQSWSYRCVGDVFALAVMWREPRPSVPERLVETVAQISFSELSSRMGDFRFTDYETALHDVGASRAGRVNGR